MELPDDLLTIYSATVDTDDDAAVIAVPERELSLGELERGGTYRIALFEHPTAVDATADDGDRTHEADAESAGDTDSTHLRDRSRERSGPPVEQGERLTVEIEDVGDQGDGIARVGPGYIVFVSDTAIGDRVTIEVTNARENFAFATVVDASDEPA